MNYAGFWRRFGALLIDCLILLIPSLILGVILPYVGNLLLVFLYRPFFESSSLMATPGKAFLGMAVTDENGARITFKQAVIRWLMSWVSGLFLCLGYFFNLFTPKRQTLHDLVARTVVIRRPEPQNVDWVGIWTAEFKRVFNIGENALGEAFSGSATSKLEDLHRLYQQGAITEAEYNAKKEELLKKI